MRRFKVIHTTKNTSMAIKTTAQITTTTTMVVVWLSLLPSAGDLDTSPAVWAWKVKEEDTEGSAVIVWPSNLMSSPLYTYNMGNLKHFIFRSASTVFKMNSLKLILKIKSNNIFSLWFHCVYLVLQDIHQAPNVHWFCRSHSLSELNINIHTALPYLHRKYQVH